MRNQAAIKLCSAFFIMGLLFVDTALSCPDIQGEYSCSSTIMKVTQSMEGDVFRYQFHYEGQSPVSLVANGVSINIGAGAAFHTASCTGDNILKYSITSFPLFLEEGWIDTDSEGDEHFLNMTVSYYLGEDGRLERKVKTLIPIFNPPTAYTYIDRVINSTSWLYYYLFFGKEEANDFDSRKVEKRMSEYKRKTRYRTLNESHPCTRIEE